MNKVIEIGRMVADPEERFAQGDKSTAITRFTLAVDRKFKKDGEASADFIRCISFGKTAEFLAKYGKKGVKFVVEGRIQTGSYMDKEGKKVFTTDVVVESAEFAESKASGEKSAPAQAQPAVDDNGFMNIPDGIDEDLPFN